jgi:hypothetical protein
MSQNKDVEHYGTTGQLLLALGGFCMLTALTTFVLGIEMQFIDAETMSLFSAAYMVIGGYMAWMSRRAETAIQPSSPGCD